MVYTMCTCVVQLKEDNFLSLDEPQLDNVVSQIRELQKTFGKLKDDVYESVKTQPVDTFS